MPVGRADRWLNSNQWFQPGSLNCPVGGSAPPVRRLGAHSHAITGARPFDSDCGMCLSESPHPAAVMRASPFHAAAGRDQRKTQPCSLSIVGRDCTAFLMLGQDKPGEM
jgi:hypothetical protein